MSAVVAKHVSKMFGKEVKALDSVDFSIEKGQLYSIVGPNGAGKTTLLRILTGSLSPTRGTVEVLGQDPQKGRESLRQKIGYMPQERSLYEELTARENVMFFGQLQRVGDTKRRVNDLLEMLELQDRANDSVHTFSGGMKTKVSLACALIHQPELLFLDEPTAAIDPLLREKIWDFLREMIEGGTTIVLTTHSMEEAMRADTVAVLQRGEMILEDSPQQIIQRGRSTVTISQDGETDVREITTDGTALAGVLETYGLQDSVDSVSVSYETMGEIITRIIKKDEHEN